MLYKNNLLPLRLKNNLSQAQMADELVMNVTVYARYERGERDMPLSIARYIAESYGVSIDYLACREIGFDKETVMENADVIFKNKEEKYFEKYFCGKKPDKNSNAKK